MQLSQTSILYGTLRGCRAILRWYASGGPGRSPTTSAARLLPSGVCEKNSCPPEPWRFSNPGGNMLRLLSASLLAGLVTVTLFSATGRAAADDKCTIAVKGDSDVAKACKDGGIKRAKATMKAMQKLGKEKGLKFECDDCHKDESAGNWTLNKDAEEKFKKLAAVK
jgi:hypothetical protein